MNEIRFALSSDESFNSVAFDRLLSGLARRAPASDRDLVIDLGRARFIDPYGTVCLVMLARALYSPTRQVAYVLPSDEDTQRFMLAMGVVEHLAPYGELRNLTRTPGPGRGDFFGLGLTPVQASTDVNAVVGRFFTLARSELGFGPGDLADSAKIVSELCSNIKDHSQDWGLATVQLYRDRNGRRYVSIGVADLGVGIRQSLSGHRPEVAGWTHQQAVEQALSGLSSRPAGGGLGLSSVREIVRRYTGHLAVRSGDTKVQMTAGKATRALRVAPFAGTQVGLSFSQLGGT
jgi:anti-sigma regulatory factor (Ser/Thr protein kinase)